ncbi:hypothetical protein AX774_g5631 [Zancudomyces culisetae]|uniref:Uncharacterized protein n=1 Tax=Zancudomyces culisetae TaxID=1213189 RepID=A0A1R1PJ41_ZANCU|nr:hypothetical protein AX774_g5631 [Zancudomyces culisetae]|eukprot:OMH80923.1 hypothetical protein AX774_g5631 [Zancudomyces culisetae]
MYYSNGYEDEEMAISTTSSSSGRSTGSSMDQDAGQPRESVGDQTFPYTSKGVCVTPFCANGDKVTEQLCKAEYSYSTQSIAFLAQLAERLPSKQKVVGSIPTEGTLLPD